MLSAQKIYHKKLLRTVENAVKDYGMLKEKDSVVIGVSGGPDSIALLHILLTLAPIFSLRLGVAHLNHGLRQKDSDKDAEFVVNIAEKLDLPCYLHKADVNEFHRQNRLSLEEAARRVRYAFLYQVAAVNKYDRIALGHHSDDNAELVLMNLFRGSGPLGLSGIPPIRGEKIIRPLIQSNRSEIIQYLNQNRLKYISDPSNRDTKYLRNNVRHHLIPLLKSAYNPKISETLNRLSSIIRCEEEWMEDVIRPFFEKSVFTVQKNCITFSIPILDQLHTAVQRRIIRKGVAKIKGNLRRISFAQIDSVVNLLKKGPVYGKLDLSDRIRIQRNRDILSIAREKQTLRNFAAMSETSQPLIYEYKITKPDSVYIQEIGAYVKFTEMRMEDVPDYHDAGQYIGFFDKDTINFPMVLRNFRPGDAFTPLGMTGTQKLKKFFINKKVPRDERKKCPILLSRGKIIWVVGYRIDESVKLVPSSRNILKVELFLA